MSVAERHLFRIPIGDWSGDGHGDCVWYDVSAAKPVEEARAAYWRAVEKLPHLAPTEFVCDYEDRDVPEALFKELLERGLDLGEREQFHVDEMVKMVKMVVWFLNQGDPELDCRLEKSNPMLPFYGYDEKKRHISFIGYGLLGR